MSNLSARGSRALYGQAWRPVVTTRTHGAQGLAVIKRLVRSAGARE